MNGHNWLAARLKRERANFKLLDNPFADITDFARAQEIADRLTPKTRPWLKKPEWPAVPEDSANRDKPYAGMGRSRLLSRICVPLEGLQRRPECAGRSLGAA
jgi:hypothetical protein